MENKVVISENKILEHNEKCFSDTQQLFSNLNENNINKTIERIENDDSYKNILPNMYFDKGRTIWLELKVEDSLLSGLIYNWMFSSSNFDNTSGLQAFGCKLESIMYSKPSGYSVNEKYAIKQLYEAAFGNNE
jgi:hypothetical protein